MKEEIIEIKKEQLTSLQKSCEPDSVMFSASTDINFSLEKLDVGRLTQMTQAELASDVVHALDILRKKLVDVQLHAIGVSKSAKSVSSNQTKTAFLKSVSNSVFLPDGGINPAGPQGHKRKRNGPAAAEAKASQRQDGDGQESPACQEIQDFQKNHGWKGKRKGENDKIKMFILTKLKIPNIIYNILSKGIKYIPYSNLNISSCMQDFDKTIKLVKNQLEKKHIEIPAIFNIFQTDVRAKLVDNLRFKTCDKLLSQERDIVNKFIQQNNIAIKPSDKNLGWVLMDLEWYVNEVHSHVLNTSTYEKSLLTYSQIFDKCNLEMSLISRKYNLDRGTLSKIAPPTNSKLPVFYILPKVHKIPISSRPVVPNVNSFSSLASIWLDKQLQKVIKVFPWILTGTKEMICLLETHRVFIADPILITADVDSMYTNIPTDAAIRHFINFRLQYTKKRETNKELLPFPFYEKKWLMICDILNWILKNNFFSFQGNTFVQIKGTAMGTNCAPTFAQIFLGIFEWKHIYIKNEPLPKWYKRYVDDTFMVCDKTEVFNTQKTINEICPFFNWSFETGKRIHFLDISIYMGGKFKRFNLFDFEPYEKPINTNLYTSPTQNYPESYKFSWLQGESIRLLRNSSNEKTFNEALQKFKMKLIKNQYPPNIITAQLAKVKWDNRYMYLVNLKPKPISMQTITIEFHPEWNILLPSIKSILNNSGIEDLNLVLCKGKSLQNITSNKLNEILK
jgi:hypothetical protein